VDLPEAAGHAAPRVRAHPGGAHQVDGEQLQGPPGDRPGQQPAELTGRPDDRGALEGEQHPPGAGREQGLRGQFDAAHDAGGVASGELVEDLRPEAGQVPDPAGAGVGDQRPGGDDPVVVRHQRAELGAVGRHDAGQHRGRQVGRGQQQSLAGELAHLEGLVHPLPAGHVLVEERGHHRVRVHRQVPAELAAGPPQP
jgi:hypothetical protein